MKKLVSIVAISIFLFPVGSLASPRDNRGATRGEEITTQSQGNQSILLKNKEERKKSLDESLEKYRNSTQDKKLETLRSHGLNAIEVRLEVINNFIKQIESNSRFDQETKDALIENTQTFTNDLFELRDKISVEQDFNQLKELVKSIHKDLKIFSVVKPKQTATMAIARIQGIVNRLKNLEKKIENLITLQEDKGEDTAGLESKLEEIKEKIVLVEEKLELAKQSFQKVSTDKEQAKAAIEEGKSYLKEARTLIKETSTLLREIVKELRGDENEDSDQIEQPEETLEETEEDEQQEN